MTTYFWPLLPPPVTPAVPGPSPASGTQGVPRKVEEIKKLMPPVYETRYPSLLGAILHAIGLEDHRVAVGERTLLVRAQAPTGNVLYIARVDDPAIRVRHAVPTTVSSPLTITVTGKDVLVSLETDSFGQVSTTAAALKAALAASTAADALLYASTFGDGLGVVPGMREFTPLDPEGLEGARRGMFLRTAIGDDLLTIADNYGISKPFLLALTDTSFRQYIAALAFQKKCTRRTLEKVLTAIFGDKTATGWNVFEVRRKTITIEIPSTLLPTGPGTGLFLRTPSRDSTEAHTGDYLRASAVPTFVPRIRPTPSSAVSNITNNSIYARMRGANRPALLNVMKLVRAAGVKVEFRQRRD